MSKKGGLEEQWGLLEQILSTGLTSDFQWKYYHDAIWRLRANLLYAQIGKGGKVRTKNVIVMEK